MTFRFLRKALIRVGYACNNRCAFCHTRHLGSTMEPASQVERKIARARALGHDMVVFSGGEPTMAPELPRWFGRAVEAGLAVGLISNGRRLAYAKYLQGLIRLRLRYVHLSLHGGRPEVHDAVVQAAAFQQTLEAIECLVARRVPTVVACVVTPLNIGRLHEVVDTMSSYAGAELKFAMPEPKGAARTAFDEIVPRARTVADAVADALDYARRRGCLVRVTHEGIPLCLLPGYETLGVDLRSHGFCSASNVGETDFFPIDTDDKIHVAPCRDCSLRGPCPGLYRVYAERRGDAELTPVISDRADHCFYEPVRILRGRTGPDCVVRTDGLAPYHRARSLWLQHEQHLQLVENCTRDLSDGELSELKFGRGQLYLYEQSQPCSGHLQRNLVKLDLARTCHGCVDLPRCAGAYGPADNDPIDADRAWLAGRLAELRGDIVDIQCGSGRQLEALGPSLLAGMSRYVGYDADLATVSYLRRRWPWADLRDGPLDAIDLAPESADHLLFVGGYNQLPRPLDVLKRCVHALRVGGSLLVVDRVPFGLVLSGGWNGSTCPRSESCGSVRGHDDTQAAEVLAPLGLTMVERRQVGPTTGYEWALVYRRAASAT